MKKSRLFALLLALTMVVSLFAGCGGDTDKPANDTPAADTPGTTTPPPPTLLSSQGLCTCHSSATGNIS